MVLPIMRGIETVAARNLKAKLNLVHSIAKIKKKLKKINISKSLKWWFIFKESISQN